MKRVVLIIALIGILDIFAGDPFHISQITLDTADCINPAVGVSGITIKVKGGTGPYDLVATNTTSSAQIGVADGNFIPVLLIDPTKPTQITLNDAAGNTIVQNYNIPSAGLVNIIIATLCPRTIVSIIRGVRDGSGIEGASLLLVGEGQKRTATEQPTQFTDLPPGNYTLTITPTGSAINSECSEPIIIPIIVPDLPFDLVAQNTVLSQGSNVGQLKVTAIEGTPPFSNFNLTGPLPSSQVISAFSQQDEIATFILLKGGFYIASVTDSTLCTITKLVTVNFFANAVANRIAIANC